MTKAAKTIRIALFTLLLSAVFTVGAAAVTLGAGTVTASALRLRAEPSTSSSILATAGEGSQVVVLDDTGDGWYKVDYHTITGYMYADYLNVAETADGNLGYAFVDTGSSVLNLRTGPGTGYEKLTYIPGTTVVPISGICNGWYKVSYSGYDGYVSSDYILLVKDADGTRADGENASVAEGNQGSDIIDLAKQYLGCRYVYGASGPNVFDCSGFTKYIFSQLGYSLNRSAANQLSNGTSVSRSNLQPGDLVFFKYQTTKAASHVGIYIGDGQFIHASSTAGKVCISDMSSGHYYNVFVSGRRIV